MKILFVSNLYGELARGGAERVVEREAAALASAGHDVVVVSGGRHESSEVPTVGPTVIRYVAPNLAFYADLHRHGLAFRFLWHLRDIWNGASARRFARIMTQERPKVVHTHNLMGLGFALPASIRRAGVRHVHTVHDVQLLHPSGLLPQDGRVTLAQRAYIAVMRRRMDSPEAVIFPSAYLRDLHDRHGFFPQSKKIVAVNPVPRAGGTTGSRGPLPSFLFVGQAERHKGVFTLLDAWKRSDLAPVEGATLDIVGDGTALEEAQRATDAAAIRGVTFRGTLKGDELTAAYDRASFVIVPSLIIENQPTVILEAMSRGVPVVASNVGGIPELLTDPDTGFLVAPGDAAALASALRRAANVAMTPAVWDAMSRNCLAWAQARGGDAHRDLLLSVYSGQPRS